MITLVLNIGKELQALPRKKTNGATHDTLGLFVTDPFLQPIEPHVGDAPPSRSGSGGGGGRGADEADACRSGSLRSMVAGAARGQNESSAFVPGPAPRGRRVRWRRRQAASAAPERPELWTKNVDTETQWSWTTEPYPFRLSVLQSSTFHY
jgi:hypothetical protein